MNRYARKYPMFWTGETGRKLRKEGTLAMLIADYLFTCPEANDLGLYTLDVEVMAARVGSPLEGALEGLRRVKGTGFAEWDEGTGEVWVVECAFWQYGELKENDNRVKGIKSELSRKTKHKNYEGFMKRYGKSLHLASDEGACKGLGRGLEAPPKGRGGEGRNSLSLNLSLKEGRGEETKGGHLGAEGRTTKEVSGELPFHEPVRFLSKVGGMPWEVMGPFVREAREKFGIQGGVVAIEDAIRGACLRGMSTGDITEIFKANIGARVWDIAALKGDGLAGEGSTVLEVGFSSEVLHPLVREVQEVWGMMGGAQKVLEVVRAAGCRGMSREEVVEACKGAKGCLIWEVPGLKGPAAHVETAEEKVTRWRQEGKI